MFKKKVGQGSMPVVLAPVSNLIHIYYFYFGISIINHSYKQTIGSSIELNFENCKSENYL